jgi:hypothetical protein
MRLATLLAMTLLFAAGCASNPWAHPTKSDQQWQADSEMCEAQGDQAARKVHEETVTFGFLAQLGRSRDARSARKSVTYICLREKGWTPPPR